MRKEIPLDGAEVTILKALEFGGADLEGETLLESIRKMEFAAPVDAINGFKTARERERTLLQIHWGYSRKLESARDPARRDQPKSRRVRRE